MKLILPVFLLVISARLSQADDQIISRGLTTIANPTQNLIPNACPEEVSGAPEWCEDLHTQSCSLSPQSNSVEGIEAEINSSVWANVSGEMSDSEIQGFSRRAITAGERAVFGNGLISKNEFSALFEDTKRRLSASIAGSALSAAAKAEMRTQVSDTNLIMGTDFLTRLETDIRSESPELTATQAAYAAIDLYTETCGASGLSVNAFNYNGSVVFCPGLIQTFQNYGATKESVQNALANVIAHEVAHSIDSAHHQESYQAMGACFEETSGSPGAWNEENSKEIVSDHWAGAVLASRLAEQGNVGRDALPSFSLATVFLCDRTELPQGQIAVGDHPHGSFRVNSVLASHPQMRNVLTCGEPTRENPSCMIQGRVPR